MRVWRSGYETVRTAWRSGYETTPGRCGGLGLRLYCSHTSVCLPVLVSPLIVSLSSQYDVKA